MLAPDVVAPIQSVTATSIMGWGGFIFGLIACAILVWKEITGRGRSLATIDGKLDRICEQYDQHEETLKIMDSHLDSLSTGVHDLKLAWKGEDGNNGAKSKLANHETRLNTIERRNAIIDEIERRKREGFEGPERRHGHRREIDRELNGLLPEEREEKP